MLDGQSHLVKQGWKGVGHPLKAGGRARPIIIAQKKTLGGIGKDRDESFAFWDHLYDVAAKSIKLSIPSDNETTSNEREETPVQVFHRTQTGILSNRPPTFLPTPSSSKSSSPPPPSISLMSRAKQEAARKLLYSRFVRGPVVTQEMPNLDSIDSAEMIDGLALPTVGAASSCPTPTTPLHANLPESNATQASMGKDTRKAEKAARKQARADRKEAKAKRRAFREEKKARKAEEAARKAAKLKKAEKKSRRRPETEATTPKPTTEQKALSATGDRKSFSTAGERHRKDKKRKSG
ncbi:hypothetical protein FRC12_007550 [Ceratobasidium sp. 428]|nr:hypothetical protein FRC12_007550 [Ceratobasidium sp. 428]